MSSLRAITNGLQPRIQDAAMERQFVDERWRSRLQILWYTSLAYLLINSIWLFLPRAGIVPEVWLVYRLNGMISAAGYIVSVFLFDRCEKSRAFYDFVVSLWGFHFLAFNGLTRGVTERMLQLDISTEIYDQGYQVLICTAWIAAFFAHAEVSSYCFLVVVHAAVGVWIALGISYDFGIHGDLFLKLSILYYVLCLLLFLHSRRSQQFSRSMWLLHQQLERQVEEEKALAQAEREASVDKVYAAKQAALNSFIVAVFDIFGRLVWRDGNGEPELCFEDKANFALDELLQRPLAGLPLEDLLGKTHGGNLDRERQRLLDYAKLEVASHARAAKESNPHVVARKIDITCTDANGDALEIELFIRPFSADSIIYGILVVQRTAPSPAFKEHAEQSRFLGVDHRWGPSGITTGSFTETASEASSASGLDVLLPADDEAKAWAWVDASSRGLPVLKCSDGFCLLSGQLAQDVKLLDMMDQAAKFVSWFQHAINTIFVEDEDESEHRSSAPAAPAFKVRLHQVGPSASKSIGLTADCSLDVESSISGPETFDEEKQTVPVLLIFKNVKQTKRKCYKSSPEALVYEPNDHRDVVGI